MVRRDIGWLWECVLVDLNTQHDFCTPNGAYPVLNAAQLMPALRSVVAWAKWNGVPVISSLDSRRLWEIAPGASHGHCLDGSRGQRKVGFTVFPRSIRVEVDNTLGVSLDLFHTCQQVIFRERADNLLANPKADRFFTQLPTAEYVLFGNALERSLKSLALGLMARGKRVTVISDACGYWDEAEADFALRQLLAKGAEVTDVESLLARRLVRRRRYGREGAAMVEAAVVAEWIVPAARANAFAHKNGNASRPSSAPIPLIPQSTRKPEQPEADSKSP
jgi:nicotinamidase-related amidase